MPSAHDDVTKIRWSYEEYVLLARGLIARYPKRNYAAAVLLADLDFERDEFDLVQKRALPKHRQRVMQTLETARRHIFQVLANLRADAASAAPAPVPEPAPVKPVPASEPAAKAARISWDPQEWKLFAFKLHSAAPDLHFLNSIDLDGLTTTLMNKVSLMMAPGRQRSFPAIEVPRARLLGIYREARAVRDPLFYPQLELPQPPKMQLTARQERMFKRAPGPVIDVTPEFVVNAHRPSPLPHAQIDAQLARDLTALEQAAPAAVQTPAAALTLVVSAPSPAPAEPVVETTRSNIIWTREEWLLLATELHRMFPGCNYPDSPDLKGMTSPEVARAQHVLREDRRRPTLKVVTFKAMLRPPLLSAFRDLKNRLASAALLPAAGQAATVTPVAPPLPAAVLPAVVASVAVAPLTPPPVNPYEAAFKPLMDLFAQQVAAQLQPLHAQIAALQASVARLSATPPSTFGSIFEPTRERPGMAPRLVPPAAVADSAVAAPPRLAKPATAPRQQLPSIGILGNRSTCHTDLLQREFPDISFTCIDSAKRIDSIKNCDKAVAMIGWASHSAVHKLKKAAGERFVRIEGGSLSELKRTIGVWIASGALPGVAAAKAPLMGTA